jgi:regulatory Fis family protein
VLTRPGQVVSVAGLGLDGAAESLHAVAAEGDLAVPFRTLREMERWLIALTLRRLLGNRTQAARELGISLRTLRNKIREFRIDEPDTLPRSGLGRIEPPPAGLAQPARREPTQTSGAFRERTWHVGCSDAAKTAREV